jgi:type IV pilus assembly protein PilA
VIRFIEKAQKRLRNEESGFTLIELLIVLVIIGILLAIAVPSYLGFKKRAEQKSSASSVRAAIPAAEAFYADNGTYVGMDNAALKVIDAGVSAKITVSGADTDSYTLTYDSDTTAAVGCTAVFNGPGGTESITNGGTCA